MPSINDVLRKALKANKQPTYGSKNDMLLRLLQGTKKNQKPSKSSCRTCKPVGKAKTSAGKTNKSGKPSKTTMYKGVKNGGKRLSAAYYFKVVCGGKLYNAEPQWICQPDGSSKLKKIKLCNDAWGGRCAKWVSA